MLIVRMVVSRMVVGMLLCIAGGVSAQAVGKLLHGDELTFLHTNTIYTMDMNTGITQILVRESAGPMAWSPDGAWLAYVGDDVYLLNTDSMTRERMSGAILGTAFTQPAWSPDGEHIVLGYTVYTIDTETRLMAAMGTLEGYAAAWSPDGTRIAYVVYRSDNTEDISVVSVEVSPFTRSLATPVTLDGIEDFAPVWTLDGHGLMFSSLRGGLTGLWQVDVPETPDAAWGEARQLDAPQAAWARLSPDGTRIAYVEFDNQDAVGLYVMAADGSGARGVQLNASTDTISAVFTYSHRCLHAHFVL